MSRTPVVDVEFLGPRRRRRRRPRRTVRRRRCPASDRRSILRRWPNAGATEREQVVGSVSGGVVPGRSRPAPTRRSVVGTNTDAGTWPTTSGVAPVRDLHADRAVLLVPGAAANRSATSRCTITSIERDRRHLVEQVAHERRRRRCTGGWRPASSRRRRRRADRSSRACIASASTTRDVRRRSATTSRRTGHDAAVDLDRGDVGAGLGERERQRAEPGADLDDVIAVADAGELGDPAHGVGVGDEVLAEIAPRGERGGVEQLADRRDASGSPT